MAQLKVMIKKIPCAYDTYIYHNNFGGLYIRNVRHLVLEQVLLEGVIGPACDLEQIYTDYYKKVMGYISARIRSRADAEDLCSEVFEKVQEILGQDYSEGLKILENN